MPGAPSGVTSMPESNPYVAAKGEWNRIHLELLRDRRRWQAVAAVELLLLLILATGLVWVAGQHKTVPYVVEVDALGAARAVKPAENGRAPTDARPATPPRPRRARSARKCAPGPSAPRQR